MLCVSTAPQPHQSVRLHARIKRLRQQTRSLHFCMLEQCRFLFFGTFAVISPTLTLIQIQIQSQTQMQIINDP